MTLEELVVKISGDTSGLENSFGKIAGIAGKAIATATAVAGAGVTALAKSAIESYADYEQLIGGVETLFKDSAGQLEKYANEAYKTAGLSANQYMENVTSFSASLLQSVGGDTAQAVESANQAMIDMSDNANKMGTSMESIQNAYQGFAKQNYTMLDNLKLGYGGTKEEMERLLADAKEISGVEYDISNLNDVYSAIHVIQTELGITGTTAKEASSTISGSATMMKSAWANLLTGIADENANFEQLIENFVNSVSTFIGNIMPRVEVALGGIANLVSELAPIIADALPGLVDTLLPSLLDGINSLVEAVLQMLPQILPTIISTITELLLQVTDTVINILPDLINAIAESLTLIVNAISESLPQLTEALVTGLIAIVDAIISNLPMFLEAFLNLVMSFVDAMIQATPQILAYLPQLISSIIDFVIGAIPQLIQAGIQLFVALVQALPDIIAQVVAVLPQIIEAIISALLENIPLIVQAGIDLLVALIEALPEIITTIITAIPEIITAIIDKLTEMLPQIYEMGVKLFVSLIEKLPEIIVEIVKAIPEIIKAIVQAITEKIPDIIDSGYNLIVGLFEGISNATQWLYGKLKTWCGNVISWIKGLFGIASPSKKMMEDGKFMVQGLALGITRNTDYVTDALSETAMLMEEAFKPNLNIPEVDAEIRFSQNSINAIKNAETDIKPNFVYDGSRLRVEEENKLQLALTHSNDNIISTLIQNTKQLLEAIEQKELFFAIGDEDIALSASRGNDAFKRRTGISLLV